MRARALLAAALMVAVVAWGGRADATTARGALVDALHTSAYGTVLVVGSGRLAGFPLYEFSGDRGRHLGCGTTRARGFDLGPDESVPLTCTGPERDLLDGNKVDDWPAFTTSGRPVAGPGVRSSLLGTRERPGVGDQVTYDGHPLYLFDPASSPFAPQGEDLIETAAPLAPWHGVWFLVTAGDGAPAPGRATLEVGRLRDGRRVLSVRQDVNVEPLAVSTYVMRPDATTPVRCAAKCVANWVPVLTTGSPRVLAGVDARRVGVDVLANGERQVTYGGRPLFLYARERVFTEGLGLRSTGTAGNGRGDAGPGGSARLVALASASP